MNHVIRKVSNILSFIHVSFPVQVFIGDYLITVQKNLELYVLLNSPHCLLRNVILYSWAYHEDISQFRDILSNILIDAHLSKSKNSAYPFR